MLRTVSRCFCITTALFVTIHFSNKSNTVTMNAISLRGGQNGIRNSKSKDISSAAKRTYPVLPTTIDDKEFGSMKLELHIDKYRRRRLLSNEDEQVKQANNSLTIKDDSVAKNYQFPDDIQEMCPFADICQLKSKKEVERPYISCCRSCYCDADCGRRGDCCFIDAYDMNSEAENTAECIKTAVQGAGGPILSYVKEYRVIDSCLSSEQTCKEKTSAPWGALFPGYSPKTEFIYLNRHCAACNNVDDFQQWKFYIMSDATDDISNENLLDALQGNGYPIVFIPPNSDGAVKKHECFKSAIKACNVTGNWQEYDSDVEEACHRFHAPVFHRRTQVMFSNIYCLVCNGMLGGYYERCTHHPLYVKGVAQNALSGLLDFTTISQTSSSMASVISGNGCPKHTVQHPYKDECRPILCPFGFTMTTSDCQLYIREWNKYGYIMLIELLPDQDGLLIPEAEFDTLTENERNNPKLWVNTQGLPMDTFVLYGHVLQNTSSVSKMVINIGGNQFPLKIDKVLSKVDRALSKLWSIKLNGYTYRFIAKFCRFRYSVQSEDYKEIDVGTRRGKHHYDNGYILITKMNFCKQVQLYDDEYYIIKPFSAIQLNLTGDGTGKILGNGEFFYVNRRLKVCIEDFVNDTQKARFNLVQGYSFTTVSLVVIGWLLIW